MNSGLFSLFMILAVSAVSAASARQINHDVENDSELCQFFRFFSDDLLQSNEDLRRALDVRCHQAARWLEASAAAEPASGFRSISGSGSGSGLTRLRSGMKVNKRNSELLNSLLGLPKDILERGRK